MLVDLLIRLGWTCDLAAGCWRAPDDPETPRDKLEAQTWAIRVGLARQWLRQEAFSPVVVSVTEDDGEL